MITPAQFLAAVEADSTVPGTPDYTPLTAGEQLLLENLVKSYPGYVNAVGKWPNLSSKIDAERAAPTDKTYMLKAVLAALDLIPEVLVESSGTDKAPSFFSTSGNWAVLAQDVLNTLYELPVVIGKQSFVLVQRTVADLALNDPAFSRAQLLGRNY